MKILSRLNLLSAGIILVMTAALLAVGMVVVGDILYRFQERALTLELARASQTIEQKLLRSGVRAAAEAAAELQDGLQGREGLHSVRLFVVDAIDRRAIFHPGFAAGARIDRPYVDQMFAAAAGALEFADSDGKRHAAFTTLQPIDWLIGLSLSKDEMLAGRSEFLGEMGGVAVLVLGLNALLIGFFGQRLLQRLGAALDCVQRIEQGNLAARIAVSPPQDELARLQGGINAMAGRLEKRAAAQAEAEAALRDSRELLASIIDNSTAVIFVKDLEGRYLLVNRRYAELFHVTDEEQRGRTDHDLFAPEVAQALLSADREVLAAGRPLEFEEVVPQDDGPHTYIAIKFPLLDASGKAYAVCGIATDITDRKARLAAEAASRAKSDFLARMSHELRTPLNAILGYADLLRTDREHPLSERQEAGLATIAASGEHLLNLINDLLDLAKIEARKFEPLPTRVDLAPFLRGVADILRPNIEAKGLTLAFELPSGLPAVWVDGKRLRQVLLNLLGNAVRFTDQGRVGLAVASLGREGEALRLRFEVSDSGVGLSAEALETVFKPFEQAGDPARRAEGTGLGLAISRELVRQMGSDILVESRPGRGSRFWFALRLPLAEAGAPAAPAAPPVVLPPLPAVVIPLPEQLAELHALARTGDMRAIRGWAKALIEVDEEHRAFGEQLLVLARGYQSRAILALVEAHLPKELQS